MNYSREPNWQKLKPEIDWDEQEEKLADKLLKQDEKNQKLKTKKINLDKFFK